MPQVVLKTGIAGPDGKEEILTAYICDWPDCPNMAEHVLGTISELGLSRSVCNEHLAAIKARSRREPNP